MKREAERTSKGRVNEEARQLHLKCFKRSESKMRKGVAGWAEGIFVLGRSAGANVL